MTAGVTRPPVLRATKASPNSSPSPRVREVILRGGRALAEPIQEISSGAVHDAAVLAAAGVPTGMIFVRSNADGVSHTPEEDSDAASIRAGTRVLARTLLELAGPAA